MRVIAGYLKGQQFRSPRTRRTHPMSDKIRGALFNSIGDITGLNILDAFAGSGAIAIEAISRGASSAVAIEKDNSAYRCIASNKEKLGLTQLKATRANIAGWSSNNASLVFDVVVCDPPHDFLQPALIRKLTRHVAEAGIMVLCWPGSEVAPELPLKLIKLSDYGDAQLAFYKR